MSYPSFRDIVPSSFCRYHCPTLFPQRTSCPFYASLPAPGNHLFFITSLCGFAHSACFVTHCVTLSDWLLSCIIFPWAAHASIPSCDWSFQWRELFSYSLVGRLWAAFTFGSWRHSCHFCTDVVSVLGVDDWSHGSSVFSQTLVPFCNTVDNIIFLVRFCYLFILAILVDTKCYLIVVLICIVWWLMMLSVFIYYKEVIFSNDWINLDTF